MLLGTRLYRALLQESSALHDSQAAYALPSYSRALSSAPAHRFANIPSCSSYYRQKIRAEFRKDSVPESSKTTLKRVSQANKVSYKISSSGSAKRADRSPTFLQLLRHLQAANDGYLHSLTRVLDTAYARRGPAKHQLLRVSLSSPFGASAS